VGWGFKGPVANEQIGGDSITAMGVMARGRKENINLSLQDILQAKSISKLALRVGSVEQTPQRKEKVEELFDLSPIQKMYFQSATSHQGGARFNQSFSLRITRKLQTQELMRAIEFIVDQHSMLRARFSKNDLGVWQQLISKVSIPAPYHIRVRYRCLLWS
jgi:Condensation domain